MRKPCHASCAVKGARCQNNTGASNGGHERDVLKMEWTSSLVRCSHSCSMLLKLSLAISFSDIIKKRLQARSQGPILRYDVNGIHAVPLSRKTGNPDPGSFLFRMIFIGNPRSLEVAN